MPETIIGSAFAFELNAQGGRVHFSSWGALNWQAAEVGAGKLIHMLPLIHVAAIHRVRQLPGRGGK